MSGLILIFIIVIWVMAVKKITTFLTTAIAITKFTKLIKGLIFTFIFLLPFADEIIGGFQFRALCEAQAQIEYDKDKLINKAVYSQIISEMKLENMAVPVTSFVQSYFDINTHLELLHFKAFDADGGWLSRAIDFNSVHAPYTFNGHCGYRWTSVTEIFKSLNVTIIKKPSGE